jgi:Leucine-rich repeat (LRR) protein
LLAWGTKLADDVVQPLEAAARARGAAQPPPGLLALALDLGLASDEADAAEITHFDVKDRHDVANLEDLDRMPALLVLRLDHGALLRGNGGAGSRLRSLRISPRERLSLGHLAHLQELVIVEAQPLDLPPALRALRLCSVECDEPIDLPPGLRSFQAEACRLTRLPDVQRCPHLVHLAITKSYIRDASPIAQHPALRTLELPHNRIEDVVPIAHASELRRIDLDANPVASIEPLARLAKLRWLSVRMTPVAQRSSRFDGVEIEA